MMTITAPGKHTVEIKDRWEELTPKEYLYVVKLMVFSTMGKIDADEFRLMYLMYISGYKQSTKPTRFQREEIEQNLFILAKQINFFFKENESGRTELSVNFTKNLLPEFRFRFKTYSGPVFYLSDLGVINTDLKANPFIDAQEYYNLYLRTKKTEALDMLVSVLYGKYKHGYSTQEAQRQGLKFKKLNFPTKYAVYIFFRALLNLITTRTYLGILFQKHKSENPEQNEDKISLGLSDTVYSLVKAGYGSQKQVGEMLFTNYLEALLKEIKDRVISMKASGKKPFDISKDTGIPIETILKLI